MAGLLFEKRAGVNTELGSGSYWRSSLSRKQLLQQVKQANIGGDQESGFETAFSSLAYAYLKDKAPRLLDFIVGFQLVDRNDDNTKAVGIFGFKVGDQWLYAPVFFLNGDLKGHELLYIKKQDAFVPMKENWVNYLISRKPHILGERSEKNTQQLGGLFPNFQRMSHPPTGAKYGSDQSAPRINDWAKPFMPVLAAVATRDDKLFAKHASLDGKFDLREFLTDFALIKLAYDGAYTKYPAIKAGFDRWYGKDFFFKQAIAAKERLTRIDLVKMAQSYVIPPEKKAKKNNSPFLIPEEEPDDPIKTGALRIFTWNSLTKCAEEATKPNKVDENAPTGITVNLPELDDAEREKLLNDNVLIKDKRDPHATSMAYNTQVRVTLTNPDETGLFEILEKPGTAKTMIVILHPVAGDGRKEFALVIRKDDPRSWLNTHNTNLWAKQTEQPTNTAYRDYVGGLDGVKSLSKGSTYVAIHPTGGGTCPFKIREDYGDGTYKVEWKDYPQFGHERAPGLPNLDKDYGSSRTWDRTYNSWDCLLRLVEGNSRKIRTNNGEMQLPDDYKIIKIASPAKPKKDDDKDSLLAGCSCMSGCIDGEDGSSSDPSPIKPGNLGDVQRMLFEKQGSGELPKISLHDTGTGFWIESPRFTSKTFDKKAALIHLVAIHGLAEEQSRTMLKEASAERVRNTRVEYLIKYADPYSLRANGGNLGHGPDAPWFPPPITGTEQIGYNSVPSIYPQEDQIPVPGMDSNLTDPSIYDPFYQPDQNAMQVAQTASQSGQKEVFDTSMVSGLLKSVSQSNLVDKYLGDLMKALDKLGRLQFCLYWHNEDFENRYGKQDLPELEDSLRNTFECLGDVVLFLKEKSVAGGKGVELGSDNVDSDTSEPDITEASRN